MIIARALLHRPKILLLDEPTTGLDPNVRQEIWDKLAELRHLENLTIVLSTHYMEEAEKLAHNLILMSRGKVMIEGSPRKIIDEKAKKFALEVRDVGGKNLFPVKNGVLSQKRGSTHIFFAETPDELTTLMNSYDRRKLLLRPSNLEDVFLQFSDNQ